MKIQFWGATDDVTGSMTFVHLPEGTVLIDCGLAQGGENATDINKLNFPINPKELIAVIITHAHLDHSGMIPRLVKRGFRGKIYCTPSTEQLMKIILMDSARLNQENNLYDTRDVNISMPMVKKFDWNEIFEIAGASFKFLPVGHILGASSVLIESNNKKLVFSGDIGREDDPILRKHLPCPEADCVVMESTYGDRERTTTIEEDLHKFLIAVSEGKRIGIIASFAVARGQTLLTMIHQFHQKNPQYKVRVVMDSPMMKAANQVYKKYKYHTIHADDLYDALDEIDAIDYLGEWESLKRKQGPLVIVASSGMLTGGRIARHLMNWHQDEKAILFMSGYQGEGTPGRSLLAGNRMLKGPDDEDFEWQGEIWHSTAFSSHADQSELINWVTPSKAQKIFLLHGSESAKKTLKLNLEQQGFKEVIIPKRGDEVEI